jgi:hypothetical protein
MGTAEALPANALLHRSTSACRGASVLSSRVGVAFAWMLAGTALGLPLRIHRALLPDPGAITDRASLRCPIRIGNTTPDHSGLGKIFEPATRLQHSTARCRAQQSTARSCPPQVPVSGTLRCLCP